MLDHRLLLPTLQLTDNVPHHEGDDRGVDDHIGDIVQGQGEALLLGCWNWHWELFPYFMVEETQEDITFSQYESLLSNES